MRSYKLWMMASWANMITTSSWVSPINRNWLEARQEIQAMLYRGPCFSRKQNKQQVPLLIPQGGVSSFPKIWVRAGVSPGVELEGWLRWFVRPFVVLSAERHIQYPALGSHTQYFCSRLFRNGSWLGFFFFLYIFWSRICPNCTCTQLFLVPDNFFVSCRSRRGVSRCSTGSHVPAPSLSQTDWHREESGESSRLKNSAFKTRKLWNQGGIRRGFQVNEPIHSPRDGRGL